MQFENAVERVPVVGGDGRLLHAARCQPGDGTAADERRRGGQRTASCGRRLPAVAPALAARPDIVGSPLTINGQVYTVVGVAADGFTGLDLGQPVDVWTPLTPPLASPNARGNRRSVGGRPPRCAGLARRGAQAQVIGIAARFAQGVSGDESRHACGADRTSTNVRVAHIRDCRQISGRWFQTVGAILMAAVATRSASSPARMSPASSSHGRLLATARWRCGLRSARAGRGSFACC